MYPLKSRSTVTDQADQENRMNPLNAEFPQKAAKTDIRKRGRALKTEFHPKFDPGDRATTTPSNLNITRAPALL